jgi:hypothetical protein
MWQIYYKDIYNDDPLWHRYDDFIDAPVFYTRKQALDFISHNRNDFDGCRIKIIKYNDNTGKYNEKKN